MLTMREASPLTVGDFVPLLVQRDDLTLAGIHLEPEQKLGRGKGDDTQDTGLG